MRNDFDVGFISQSSIGLFLRTSVANATRCQQTIRGLVVETDSGSIRSRQLGTKSYLQRVHGPLLMWMPDCLQVPYLKAEPRRIEDVRLYTVSIPIRSQSPMGRLLTALMYTCYLSGVLGCFSCSMPGIDEP